MGFTSVFRLAIEPRAFFYPRKTVEILLRPGYEEMAHWETVTETPKLDRGIPTRLVALPSFLVASLS